MTTLPPPLSTMRRLLISSLLLTTLPALATPAVPAAAPASTAASAPAEVQVCLQPGPYGQQHMLGEWFITLNPAAEELSPALPLQLAAHPEYAGSLRGTLLRQGRQVQVAGEMRDARIGMEESVDGTRTSGLWRGDVVPGSCGELIEGDWLDLTQPTESWVPFLMQRASR